VIARQIEDKHQLRDQAEREVLGFDHAEVGALLLEAWGLPRELAGLARCHHQYQLAQDNVQAALMLAMANLLTETGATVAIESDPRLAAMLEQLDMDRDTLAEIVDISDRQAAEVKNIVLG
jgi:HD-like signal output (HDOD) protein